MTTRGSVRVLIGVFSFLSQLFANATSVYALANELCRVSFLENSGVTTYENRNKILRKPV